MKELLRKEGLFLQYLVNLPDNERRLAVKSLTNSQIRVICGIVCNAIKQVVSLKRKDINLLKKYNSTWSVLIAKNTNRKQKQAIIIRRIKEICLILRAAIRFLPTGQVKHGS